MGSNNVKEERMPEKSHTPMNDVDVMLDMIDHRDKVAAFMCRIAHDLSLRAIDHDKSKFSERELPAFLEATPGLRSLTYGSEEYKKELRRIKPAVDSHYLFNRHHPEHFADGISGMDLVDLIEMLCDWAAAVKRHDDSSMEKSVEINKDRFMVTSQLHTILLNTIKNYHL